MEDSNEKGQGQNEFQLGRDMESDKIMLCKGIRKNRKTKAVAPN